MTKVKSFDITFRIRRKSFTWQRFAATKEAAIHGAILALQNEYGERGFVISSVVESKITSEYFVVIGGMGGRCSTKGLPPNPFMAGYLEPDGKQVDGTRIHFKNVRNE